MNVGVVHPGDNVKLTFTFDGNESAHGKEQKIQGKNSSLLHPATTKQHNQQTAKTNVKRNPPVTRRRSSLKDEVTHCLDIEGLLIVPEFEKRLRRNSYNGVSVHDDKETAVDPSDGMLTTSLCTTEL